MVGESCRGAALVVGGSYCSPIVKLENREKATLTLSTGVVLFTDRKVGESGKGHPNPKHLSRPSHFSRCDRKVGESGIGHLCHHLLVRS